MQWFYQTISQMNLKLKNPSICENENSQLHKIKNSMKLWNWLTNNQNFLDLWLWMHFFDECNVEKSKTN